jgi:glycosyltransferase involved in cell wall biosynthesis
MKMLLLAPQPFYQNRGTPIAVKLLVETLATYGHRIDILTYNEGESIQIPNVSIHRIPGILGISNIMPGPSWKKLASDVILLIKCIAMVKKYRFDMIHAVEESAFIGLFMRLLFKIPYVYDMDSSLALQMIEKYQILRPVKFFFNFCEKATIRKSIGVIAVCKYIEEIVYEYEPNKLLVRLEDISLLCESTEQGESLKETLRIDGPVIMYVGNLEKYQGIDLLLECFQLVTSESPTCHLVIIGGTTADISRYRDKSRRLGLVKRTHFIGQRPISQLASFLAQTDILVSPRIQGGNTPMKIYSYLDSGKPLIATKMPTHTQVLDEQIAVLTHPDPTSMADGILSLIRDQKRASIIAQNAKERVKNNYSREVFDRKLIAFYKYLENMILNENLCPDGGKI